MKNKKLILIAVAVIALIGVMLGVYFATRPETSAGSKTFTVTVVHKDGTSKDFTYSTDEEYLGAVLTAEGLLQGTEGPYGIMIDTVDGETASWDADQSYWAVYIGSEYATTGIDQIPIEDGGSYKLEYTIG
jgi:hypothetical protein